MANNFTSLDEKILISEENFKSFAIIDNDNLKHTSGFYCIRIKNYNKLPKPFNKLLKSKNHNIIYIGKATKLRKRLHQELKGKGHGTFFRSIGAILNKPPIKNSGSNKYNFTFSFEIKEEIIKWIGNNLIINWIESKGDLKVIETKIIRNNSPLLNIQNNPDALEELKNLRKEYINKANS